MLDKAFLNLDEMGYDIIILYIFSFHFGTIIFVFYPEAVVRRWSLKVFYKIWQNSQENTSTGVSFLSAASNFINEETLAQCFPKPLTIFPKSSIVDVRLDYK